jgi:nucleoside-diphosphate-sugar epimerase
MITVFGGTGFIGSHLIKKLKETETDFLTVGRADRLPKGNLGHVIYCIGVTADFRSRLSETVEAHVCKLLEVLQTCELDSLLYLSSTRVYAGGEQSPAREEDNLIVNSLSPDNLYNISKVMGESVALNCSGNSRVARISNVYGGDFTSSNFLSSVIREALVKKQVTLHTALDSEKDYIGIDDVVDALIRIATGGNQRIYNVAGGINTSNDELLKRLSGLTGCRVEVSSEAPKVRFPQVAIDRMRDEFGFRPSGVLDNMSGLVRMYKDYMREDGK